MKNKRLRTFFIVVVILAIVGLFVARTKQKSPPGEMIEEITPVIGSIRTFISCTGTVLPKNRLEIKPPVNGRIESVLIREGEKVKVSQILAWMSSTERAALLDAARGKEEKEFKYWEETYKPIPLTAPIDGEVIVATTQPGQTITTSDAVVVLSDHLIIRAQVDETDIGKITPSMKAIITLDAYPDTKINTAVEHIYYESKTVNNVTIYEVDLIPTEVPLFFRSGMNASVDFIQQGKENALLIPQEALFKEKDEDFVWVRYDNNQEPQQVRVKLGISDDNNVEIISGIKADDKIVLKTKKYSLPKSTTGKNPFMPGH
jgi:macrolide-specific efflux system membrane fusion protein